MPTDFAPIELMNPTTGQTVRLARSYDTMLYDTVRTPAGALPAGNVANLFTGQLNGFAAKTGAENDDLIVSSKLPSGSVALVHKLCFEVDVSRPDAVGLLETEAQDVLSILRECFATLQFNGQTSRRLGRISFYPPWFQTRSSMGAGAVGPAAYVSQAGTAVSFAGPVILGAWGSSQISLTIENARAIAYLAGAFTYDITAVMDCTILNPINPGDGI